VIDDDYLPDHVIRGVRAGQVQPVSPVFRRECSDLSLPGGDSSGSEGRVAETENSRLLIRRERRSPITNLLLR
jgi:hypothetical protein